MKRGEKKMNEVKKFKVHTTGRNTKQELIDTCTLVITVQKGAKVKWSKLKRDLYREAKLAGILKKD